MNAKRMAGLLAFVLSLGATLSVAAEEKPRLAVLMMDSYSSGLTADEVVGLTDVLAAGMTKGGRYSVMPREEVRERLVEKKGKAKKSLGPPPDKVLESIIGKVGKQCVVVVRLYNVSTAIMESSAFRRGPCSADAMLEPVEVMASDLTRAEVDPEAPLIALHLFESRGSGLKANEVVSLWIMAGSALVAAGGARLLPTDRMRKNLAVLSGGAAAKNPEVRYSVSGVIGRMAKRCLTTVKIFDLSESTLIMALPERSLCEPESLIHMTLNLSQDLAKEMRKLRGSATGKKQESPAPTSPITLPPRRASPASGH